MSALPKVGGPRNPEHEQWPAPLEFSSTEMKGIRESFQTAGEFRERLEGEAGKVFSGKSLSEVKREIVELISSSPRSFKTATEVQNIFKELLLVLERCSPGREENFFGKMRRIRDAFPKLHSKDLTQDIASLNEIGGMCEDFRDKIAVISDLFNMVDGAKPYLRKDLRLKFEPDPVATEKHERVTKEIKNTEDLIIALDGLARAQLDKIQCIQALEEKGFSGETLKRIAPLLQEGLVLDAELNRVIQEQACFANLKKYLVGYSLPGLESTSVRLVQALNYNQESNNLYRELGKLLEEREKTLIYFQG